MKFILFAMTLLFTLNSNSAKAANTLKYKTPNNYKEIQALSAAEIKDDHVLAKIDLNEDFISEYIAKPANCAAKQFCTYTIIAYMNRSPIIIGQFDAHQITPLKKKDYGVRRLNIYNVKRNDFAFNTARWNPRIFKYSTNND